MENKVIAEMSKDELVKYQSEKENDLRKMLDVKQVFSSKDIELKIKIKELRQSISNLELQKLANDDQMDKAVTNVQILRSLLSDIKNRMFNGGM